MSSKHRADDTISTVDNKRPHLHRGLPHYVVAIGASAGGLEAIHEFFDNMPETEHISFIIIQHLSPDYKSLLVDLVSRHTHMKVFEAENDSAILRNCIYVIPNNKLMTLERYRLVLTEKQPAKFPNNAIDVFMQSMASELKDNGIAVVLSGTGSDGTKGIRAVKEAGGTVIVQEPSSSKFDGMPNSAITTGNVDHVLPPAEMPRQILNILEEKNWGDDEENIDDDTLNTIFEHLHHQAGFALHYYKTPTITRRLFHRMRKNNFSDVVTYSHFLQDNAEECRQLAKDLLINVTRFFRDPEAFEGIRNTVLPNLLNNRSPEDPLKVWICACSTGEEAFSLAILVDEVLRENQIQGITAKFFATDIEQSNIDIASKGYYPATIETDVSPERLNQYFTKQGDGYAIIPRIRKQIVFAVHNVLRDPPFIKNDLVSCRNMLIYMGGALQQRVYSLLLFALKMNGHLFLGPTENPTFIKNNLKEVDAKWKVFEKVSDAKVAPILAGISDHGGNGKLKSPFRPHTDRNGAAALWDDLRDTLLQEFNFAGFYIDRAFEIKEALGSYDRILSLPKKILKLNLVRMLPGDISTTLVTEVKRAWKSNQKQTIRNLPFRNAINEFRLDILIQPEAPDKGRPLTFIAFQFSEVPRLGDHDHKVLARDESRDEYMLSLEEELNETRGNLQHAVEDLQTTNEELQSSNEELLSANEELQSTNEELQSLNEELHTLNTEHQSKIKELIELNDDLNNYFKSSDIGQVIVDRQLVIRKFNPASVRMINLIESDVGRPITHLSINVRYAEFITDIKTVLATKETLEREVQLNTGINLLLKIMPYVTRDRETNGVVVSFFDITTITNLNNIIRGVFNSSLSAIFALKAVRDHKGQIADFTIDTTNYAGAKLLDRAPEEIKPGLLVSELNKPFFSGLTSTFVGVVEQDQPIHTDLKYTQEHTWFEVTAVKMLDGLVVTYSDITQKKTADERLKKNYSELITTKEDLKKLNAQLEEKVRSRTELLSESEERFRMVSRATNDIIWDWDIVHNQIWVSEAFHLQFGYEPDMVLNRQAWLDMVHPDDQKKLNESIQDAINKGNTQWTHEYRFRKADESYCTVLDRAYVVHDSYHTPFRMIGSMLDISDLRSAEQAIEENVAQRKFLAESIPLTVMLTDAAGQADFVNQRFELYTGIPIAQALGHGWMNVIHVDDRPKLTQQWDKPATDQRDFQEEVRVLLLNETYHWNIFTAKVQRDEPRNESTWVVTLTDIHDQKQLTEVLEKKVDQRTEALRRMNDALEVSNNDLQQFASVASHDLQEPLRKIHLYSNMMRDQQDGMSAEKSLYLDKILGATVRMKSIISSILNYSKLSADNQKFEPTDLNAIISEIIEDLEVAIIEKNAVINVGKIPMIDTTPGQIRQVFQNMIGNALKFSRKDIQPTVNITAERIDSQGKASADGDRCRILISDNGIGFDKKFAQSIFVLFQRLHSKDVYEGTGIGLAIAKKIVEKHDGQIMAYSKEGEGATFVITLPIHHKGTSK